MTWIRGVECADPNINGSEDIVRGNVQVLRFHIFKNFCNLRFLNTANLTQLRTPTLTLFRMGDGEVGQKALPPYSFLCNFSKIY